MNSSFIDGVSYSDGVLGISISGRDYTYNNVPFHVFQKFVASPSRGTFFNRFIKPLWSAN